MARDSCASSHDGAAMIMLKIAKPRLRFIRYLFPFLVELLRLRLPRKQQPTGAGVKLDAAPLG